MCAAPPVGLRFPVLDDHGFPYLTGDPKFGEQLKEVYRRTRVGTLFPNEAALLSLVSAVLIETSQEWETRREYLNFEPE